MLIITQEIITTIVDLAEEYADARVACVAAEDSNERWVKRCDKVARYKDLVDYLCSMKEAQCSPHEVTIERQHTEFTAARQIGFILKAERRRSRKMLQSCDK